MKRIVLISIVAALSTMPAYADGGRGGWRDGGGRGGGWGGAWIVPALIGSAIVYGMTRPQPVYVQPAPVYAPDYPQVYAPVVASAPAPSWYFCPAANAYYPYVSSCAGGWQAVPVTPPPAVPGAPYAPPPPR